MSLLGLDYLFVSVSSDMLYLTGYITWPSERLTLFVLPREDEPFMLMPAFEAPLLEAASPFFEVLAWEESQDPIAALDARLGLSGSSDVKRIGVSDAMASRFLLPIQERAPDAKWEHASRVLTPLRMIKDAEEVAALEHAQSEAMRCLGQLAQMPFAGQRELDVGQALWGLCLDSQLKVSNFAIVGSGPNGSHPHYHIGDRVIREGDSVVIDFGGVFNGYHADLTRTFHVGQPSTEFLDAYALVQRAQEAAIGAMRPGVTCEAIDAVARSIIADGGHGPDFTHRTGHGIGLDEHEAPYLVAGNALPLWPGMTFTVEPGIYVSQRFGIRIEDQVLVTETGSRRLGELSRDLVVVG